MEDWRAEYVRLTVLFNDPKPSVDESWWRAVMNVDRDAFSGSHGSLLEFKDLGPYRYSLIQVPGRIDWNLGPALVAPPSPDQYFPDLGDISSAWRALSDRILPKWLEIAPPLCRIAIAGAAHVVHQDEESATKQLQQIIPGFVIKSFSDFSLQTNSPMRSKNAEDQQINVIRRWSGLPQGTPMAYTQDTVILLPLPTVRLDFDCNNRTHSDRNLNEEERRLILEELVAVVEGVMPKVEQR